MALQQDAGARLACFDQWAAAQNKVAPVTPPETGPSPAPLPAPVVITMEAPEAHNCKNPRFTEMSRFWELEAGSDCDALGLRGYKPISLSWTGANSVNTQPSSPSLGHTALTSTPYSNNEMRIQLSVRSKVAQGLLTQGEAFKRDSIWFGYSQQSYWQVLNGDLSRPFRSTDHEPELIYIYPLDMALGQDWRWRYAGLSLNHQSNGQSLPLSRSWNRSILMAGFEKGNSLQLQARVWQRIPEATESDDNPDIADLVGRAELAGVWHPDAKNTLGLTLRHSLRAQANGSVRLEWLRSLTSDSALDGKSGLRFHTQLFSGYGDSLLDYNHRRTVLSVGLSLVDW
jgi:phospholipase A1/A2